MTLSLSDAVPKRRHRILVVDDEPDIVRALALRLKSAGYELLVASDAVQATRIAVKEQPDLILLDIGLPGGDGHTVASRLRANLKTVNIPLIFLTARSGSTDRQKAQLVAPAGYLIKPYQPEELLRIIEEALQSG